MTDQSDSYDSAADVLGCFNGIRPRPTYAIPLFADWQTKSHYPKSNSRRISPTATVHWKLGTWRKVDGPYEGVQTRSVIAAAFEADELACCFTCDQTRNGTDDEMNVEEYAVTCDDASRSLGQHASLVQHALSELDARDWLWPGEAATELSALFVPSEFRNKLLWRPAMLEVLDRLATANGRESQVCILMAKPLETAWRQQILDDNAWAARQRAGSEVVEPSARELELAARRAIALQTLYQRELGFVVLDAPWMARLVEPIRSRARVNGREL